MEVPASEVDFEDGFFQTIRNNARQLQHSLDLIEDLNKRLRALVPSTSVPEINRAQMELLIRQGGPAGRLARQLQTQINDTAGELGGIIMNGNSPTDHALEIAQSNMQSNWSAEDLQNAVNQARYNVGTRLQAMSDASVASAGDNIRAKVGSTFAALSAQGLKTIKDFDNTLDKKRSDGKTLRQALNEQGWSDDDIATLRGLLVSGQSANSVDIERVPAIVLAARGGYAEAIELLVSHGARVDVRDRDGSTALFQAAQRGHEDAVAALVKAKAALEAEGPQGETALIAAARRGHASVVSVLVKAGAD